jgi:hypothetical protein
VRLKVLPAAVLVHAVHGHEPLLDRCSVRLITSERIRPKPFKPAFTSLR